MLDAIKSINSDFKTNLNSFKTKLDADERNAQKRVFELAAKRSVAKKSEEVLSNNNVDYNKFENEVKNFLEQNNLAIEFSIDSDSKKMVMKLIDEETKEVIKQFPSELSFKIARMLSASLEAGNITDAVV